MVVGTGEFAPHFLEVLRMFPILNELVTSAN